MSKPPAYARAAEIEATLDLLAEQCGDPTPHVYARLFSVHPTMEAYFWRDTTGAVKGEMLARTFEAILDFVGERRYAQHMISTEMVTHEGYDIPREVFTTFFGIVRDTARDLLAEAWTPAFETAWAGMLAEMDVYAQATPRTDTPSAYFTPRLAEFEAPFAAKA
jgi:hemoglobin-like flavoprotein